MADDFLNGEVLFGTVISDIPLQSNESVSNIADQNIVAGHWLDCGAINIDSASSFVVPPPNISDDTYFGRYQEIDDSISDLLNSWNLSHIKTKLDGECE